MIVRDYGDYIIYVDESGDPNLENPNPSYPMFVLSLCIFKKADYTNLISPSIQSFKFKFFGHDAIVLHEREIRKQTKPFVFLKSIDRRKEFMSALNKLVDDAPMTIIAAAINKPALKARYVRPTDPYHLALRFCIERASKFLETRNQVRKSTHLVFEKRGKDEDRDLELEFRRIKDGGNFTSSKFDGLEIVFADKKANSGGLQLADLTARPIGLKCLRPEQVNRAFDIIESKLDRNHQGLVDGFGLKQFP